MIAEHQWNMPDNPMSTHDCLLESTEFDKNLSRLIQKPRDGTRMATRIKMQTLGVTPQNVDLYVLCKNLVKEDGAVPVPSATVLLT
jgi:hypothetical protein